MQLNPFFSLSSKINTSKDYLNYYWKAFVKPAVSGMKNYTLLSLFFYLSLIMLYSFPEIYSKNFRRSNFSNSADFSKKFSKIPSNIYERCF